jgi:hypothetical protein
MGDIKIYSRTKATKNRASKIKINLRSLFSSFFIYKFLVTKIENPDERELMKY